MSARNVLRQVIPGYICARVKAVGLPCAAIVRPINMQVSMQPRMNMRLSFLQSRTKNGCGVTFTNKLLDIKDL